MPDHVKQRYFQGPSSGRVAPESCAAGWGLMSWTCDVSTSIVERLGFAAAVDVGVEDGAALQKIPYKLSGRNPRRSFYRRR